MARRGYVAGALGAAALLVAGLSVARVVLAFDDGEVVEPISADAAYAIDGPLTCDTELNEVPTLPLEAEPVALLLCADPEGSVPWTSPVDVVEGDLAELRAVLDGLEPTPDEDYACTMQGGPAYDLHLRFSRDRYARIHGDTGGCGVVTTGIGEWFGANDVLDTALALVEEQRDRDEPPPDVATLDLWCDRVLTEGGPASSLTGDPADLVRLVSCWQPNARQLGEWSEARVRPADVRTLARDVGRHAAPGDARELRCPGGLEQHYFQHLIGQTAWGDLVVIAGECRRFVMLETRPDGGDSVVWRPTPRSQRILDSLRR
jgi:hypothetical protein